MWGTSVKGKRLTAALYLTCKSWSDRCKQGKKNCQPSSPVRKRRIETRHPANKVGKLEEKLDGLVALLKSATSGTPEHLDTTPVNPGSNLNSRISIIDSSAAGGFRYPGYTSTQFLRTENASLDSSLIPTATSTSGFGSTRLPSLVHPALEPSPEDAESYLNRFRTDFIKHLPFIVISPAVSAQQLRHTSPFLWFCIMTVASTRSSQQIVLSREVREIFGRETYLGGTRSMDLLLAVLVYATW